MLFYTAHIGVRFCLHWRTTITYIIWKNVPWWSIMCNHAIHWKVCHGRLKGRTTPNSSMFLKVSWNTLNASRWRWLPRHISTNSSTSFQSSPSVCQALLLPRFWGMIKNYHWHLRQLLHNFSIHSQTQKYPRSKQKDPPTIIIYYHIDMNAWHGHVVILSDNDIPSSSSVCPLHSKAPVAPTAASSVPQPPRCEAPVPRCEAPWMVGRGSFPFGMVYFQGLCYSFRVNMTKWLNRTAI